MVSKHLCNFLAIMNLGVRTKKAKISVRIKANYIKLFIDLLFKENYIYGYFIESKKEFYTRTEEVICINFKPKFIKRINLISSPSFKKCISAYELHSLHYKNPGSFFIMSSSELGFSTSRECQKRNIGGILICELKI